MEWKSKGGVVQANNESKGSTAKYTYVTKLTSADNKEVFTCRTSTTHSYAQGDPNQQPTYLQLTMYLLTTRRLNLLSIVSTVISEL